MKYIFIVLTIVLTLNLNKAQSETNSGKHSDISSIDSEVLEGLDDIYNLQFDNAESKFKKLQKSNPNDLRGFFYESLIYFYKALPTRDEESYNKYIELTETVIDKAEKLLEKNENDYDAMYYKGLSHSYVSLLMLSLNKNLLKAASNGNDGYRILSTLTEKKPDYYDAYMGLGLYKIAIGFVPEKFQWLLSMIGFDGNINEGINYLKKSLTNGRYTKTDSKVFLSIFSIREKEDEDRQALDFSKELTESYPESSVFKVFYASLLLQYGKTEDAIAIADLALKQNKNSFQGEIIKSSNALLGTAYFRLNDFQKATEYLEVFMKYVNPEDRYNVYLFTLGVSYELSGNRQKALEKYKMVRDDFVNERDGELDKFFYRFAQEKIKKPLRDFDIKLVTAMNLRESFKFDEALSVYDQLVETYINVNTVSTKKSVSDDDLIRLYYDIGVTYTYKKSNEKALEYFNKCIKLNPENERWLVPHSYFEIGKIYSKQKNKKKSEEMFEAIYNYDDFDFKSFLEMRLANYLNK